MICWFEGLESFLLLLPEIELSLLSWLLGKLKWRFVVLKARLFSVANESTHWLKFTKAEAFTRQCTFNGWAVHGSVKFGTIDLMVLGWWQTSSLMKVGGFWEASKYCDLTGFGDWIDNWCIDCFWIGGCRVGSY